MANLRFRTLPRFPARLLASGGLAIDKVGADWTVRPDFGALSPLSNISDPVNSDIWVRVVSAGVSTFFRMTLQALLTSIAQTGAGIAIPLTIDTASTADADPGAGILRFNNATQNAATQFFVDLADLNGFDITTILDSLDDSTSTVKGNWSLHKISDGTKKLTGTLSAVTTVAGYRKLTIAVTGSSSASPFSNADSVLFQFTRNGDAGAIGGSTGATDNALLRADGVGGATVQNSTITVDDSGAVTVPEMSAPSTPASGKVIIYPKSDGRFYEKDDAGTERGLSSVGKHSIPVPASHMTSRATNGPSLGVVEMATNKNMFRTLDFDASTEEFAQFIIPRMPKGWNESTITFRPIWSHPSTATNFGVVWALEAIAISDDDAGDVAFGTAQTSTDTGGTTNDIYHGPESAAITVGGTPAENDSVMFQIKRVPADGSDTLAVDARLHGIELLINTNAATDD